MRLATRNARVHGADAPEAAFATSRMVCVVANDADELGESMRDWALDLRQLQPGGFEAAVMVLPLGPALICSGRYNQSLLQHVASPADCLSIDRPGRGSDPLIAFGREVQADEVFVSGPRAECESMSRGVLFPTALSVKLGFLQTQTDWLNDSRLQTTGEARLHRVGAQWTSNFLDAMEWIFAAVAQYPSIVTRADVCGSLLDTLLARVNALDAVAAPLRDNREMRSARLVAVERAREYIHLNLTDPIRLSDLCRYARTQARSLEYGFHETVGVSPMAYIRATRLHRVRRLLRSTAVRTRSISEIALDCGFWHLSQFAMDYKRQFAESPSVTYRRTHSQLPRAERRNVAAARRRVIVPRSSGAMGGALTAPC